MAFLSLQHTALHELIDQHGWFDVTTAVNGGGEIRTVVYLDGDVSTKLFQTRTVDAETLGRHAASLTDKSAALRRQLRRVRLTVLAACITAASLIVAFAERWLEGVAVAVIVLAPLVVAALQQRVRTMLRLGAQSASILSAVGALALAVALGIGSVAWAVGVALVFDVAVFVASGVARRRLQRMLLG